MNLGMLPRGIATLLRNKLGVDTPLLWDHKVTFRCQALCGFCPFNAKLQLWNEYGPELTTEEVISLADQMYDLGCVMSSFEGGEPLLRKDLPEILRHCGNLGFSVHMVTNGGLLKRHAPRVAPLCDVLTVSLDFPDRRHDRERGPGIFDGALEGIRAAREFTRVTVNTVITRQNLHDLPALVELVEDLGAAGITFEPVQNINDLDGPFRLDDQDAYHRAIRGLKEMKTEGAPILNTDGYLDVLLGTAWECESPRLLVHTDPYGNMKLPCGAWGNRYGAESLPTKGKKVRDIWYSREATAARLRARGCTSCAMACSVEPSLAFGNPSMAIYEGLRIARHLQGPRENTRSPIDPPTHGRRHLIEDARFHEVGGPERTR